MSESQWPSQIFPGLRFDAGTKGPQTRPGGDLLHRVSECGCCDGFGGTGGGDRRLGGMMAEEYVQRMNIQEGFQPAKQWFRQQNKGFATFGLLINWQAWEFSHQRIGSYTVSIEDSGLVGPFDTANNEPFIWIYDIYWYMVLRFSERPKGWNVATGVLFYTTIGVQRKNMDLSSNDRHMSGVNYWCHFISCLFWRGHMLQLRKWKHIQNWLVVWNTIFLKMVRTC